VENEDAQICVLKAGYDLWMNDTQMLSVVVDLLLKYQIVSCAAVANWVFMQEMTADFTRLEMNKILRILCLFLDDLINYFVLLQDLPVGNSTPDDPKDEQACGQVEHRVV